MEKYFSLLDVFMTKTLFLKQNIIPCMIAESVMTATSVSFSSSLQFWSFEVNGMTFLKYSKETES